MYVIYKDESWLLFCCKMDTPTVMSAIIIHVNHIQLVNQSGRKKISVCDGAR